MFLRVKAILARDHLPPQYMQRTAPEHNHTINILRRIASWRMFEAAVGGALTKVLHDDCENRLSWVRIPVPTHRSLLAKLIVGGFFPEYSGFLLSLGMSCVHACLYVGCVYAKKVTLRT